MKTYIGVKKIEAEPMTRGDYNTYRGWQIPTELESRAFIEGIKIFAEQKASD